MAMPAFGNMAHHDPYGQMIGQHGHHGYGILHNMKPPLGHGLSARRQLNWVAMFTAFVVPFGLFVVTFCVMSFQLYYHRPGISCSIVAMAFLFTFVIGAFALQAKRTEQKGGQRTWHFFMFATGLMACSLGSLLGVLNMSMNAETYYDYISLRKAVDVSPGESRGQQLLDAGEVDFKVGTKLDRSLHFLWHKSKTYCVAPIVPEDGAKMASYDFWAVGMDCCSLKPDDFSCAPTYTSWTSANETPKGLRVMNSAEIQGYTLAVQQASAAHNIQTQRPIFLYMDRMPYLKIKQYYENARFCAMASFIAFGIVQAALVFISSYHFGKGNRSGFMDIEKTARGHGHMGHH
jgi:hypothetical protein